MKNQQNDLKTNSFLRILLVLQIVVILLLSINTLYLWRIPVSNQILPPTLPSIATSTIASIQTAFTQPTTPPSITASPTNIPDQVSELTACENQIQDICYYAPGMQNGEFLISLYIANLDTIQVPYILLGTNPLSCEISKSLLDVIICKGPLIENGNQTIELYSSNNELLSSGMILIDFTVLGAPTKTRDSSDPVPSYP